MDVFKLWEKEQNPTSNLLDMRQLYCESKITLHICNILNFDFRQTYFEKCSSDQLNLKE